VLITQGGLPRYHAVWEWDAEFDNGTGNPPGRLEYNRYSITSVLTSGEDLDVQITASEPMDEIYFTVGSTLAIHTALDYTENSTIAWFEISSSFLESLIVNEYHTLNITGQDLTLNFLTGFPSSPPDYTAAQLPHRTGASSWSTPFSNTTDWAHFFYLSNCFPGEGESGPCILDAGIGLFNSCGNVFNPVGNNLCAGAALEVYDFSCAACAETAEWNFDGGTAELIDADPDYYLVSWDTPGTYTVSLSLWGSEAFNEDGMDTYSQTITVSETGCTGNGMEDITVGFTITPTCIGSSEGSVSVSVSPSGSYTYSWLNAGGQSIGTEQNLQQATAGTYTFILENTTDNCTGTWEVEVPPGVTMQVLQTNAVCRPVEDYYELKYSITNLDYNPVYWVTDNDTGNSQPIEPILANTLTITHLPNNYTVHFDNDCGGGGEFSGTHDCCGMPDGEILVTSSFCLSTFEPPNIFHWWARVFLTATDPIPGIYTKNLYLLENPVPFHTQTWDAYSLGQDQISALIPQGMDEEYFRLQITDPAGCIFVYTFNCDGAWVAGNDIIVDENGNPTQTPPIFSNSFPDSYSVCPGVELCIPYSVSDPHWYLPVSVLIADNPSNFEIEERDINLDYPIRSGLLCFTPQPSQTGIQHISILAIDGHEITPWYSYHHITVDVLCCPTGFDYPQELEAVYDCNGDLYQPAEATVTALTNGCNLDFTVNGSANHTLGHLGEGVYDLTLSFNNQTYLIEDAITVSGIYMDDGNLQITHTIQPSLAACSSDQCNGQISLSVSEGSGNYTYHWSDCIPPPGEMMLPCNSPLRNHLCSGSYTVTVADDLTGCESVYSVNVNLYYPPNAGVLSDNEFSVSPTVFSGSTTLTYRVGYDAQVSISMFNGQGILVDSPIQQEFRAEGQYNMTHSPPSGLPQGVYYYVLYVCEQYITRVAIKIG